jgi:hypothetical protein
VQTHRDELVIDFSKEKLYNRLKELFTTDNLKSFALKFEVTESNSWSLDIAIKKEVALKNEIFRKITYRPFDERSIYYSDNFVDRTRKNIGKEIVKENLVLNFPKIVKVDWCHSLITKSIQLQFLWILTALTLHHFTYFPKPTDNNLLNN